MLFCRVMAYSGCGFSFQHARGSADNAGTGTRDYGGNVDIWPDSEAVQSGGQASSRLQASGIVSSLLQLPNGGIAAGTSTSSGKCGGLFGGSFGGPRAVPPMILRRFPLILSPILLKTFKR